jgi:hypothetical protein
MDLSSLDLTVRTGHGVYPGEKRLELRIASTGVFVAWFQLDKGATEDHQKTSINAQLVDRDSLKPEQYAAAQEWLRNHVLETLQ